MLGRSWVLQAAAKSAQELTLTGEVAVNEFTKTGRGKSRVFRHGAIDRAAVLAQRNSKRLFLF